MAICRLSDSRNVRLKWRRLSGPTLRMLEYLIFSTGIVRRPRGWILGSSSSSPRIVASSSRLTSTSRMWFARLGSGLAAEWLARLTLPLADAPLLPTEAKAGDLYLRQRDRHNVLALPADQLALGKVLAKLLLDHPPHDLSEALHVSVDLAQHGGH